MVAVGPAIIVISLMFFIRPVGGHRQNRPSDGMSFSFVYSVCILLAAYLMAVMLLEDLVPLNNTTIMTFTAVLFVLLAVPIVIPIWLCFFSPDRNDLAEEALLLPQHQNEDGSKSGEQDGQEVILSEVEDEKPKDMDLLPASERHKRIAHLQAKLFQAAAAGAVRVKRRRGPHRGEDFTLGQALIKADFWLIFFSLLLGSGSGLTIIDNLGQLSDSLGIWNFLGRVGGGYISEVVVRDYAYPRPVTMAVAQFVMAFGHIFFAFDWPGAMYIGTLLIGLGYGSHWAIVPATASELFGLKKFGALYNFLTLANPAGSLIFSGVIASSIYDREAEKQAGIHNPNSQFSIFPNFFGAEETLKCEGSVCYFMTCMIMSGFCVIAGILSLILVRRTKVVYTNLYGKPRT
ncbi:Protein NUCLEAR FUSION DEFECTIVE 4 [Linum perenne]